MGTKRGSGSSARGFGSKGYSGRSGGIDSYNGVSGSFEKPGDRPKARPKSVTGTGKGVAVKPTYSGRKGGF